MKKNNFFLITLLLQFVFQITIAQSENSTWYFGSEQLGQSPLSYGLEFDPNNTVNQLTNFIPNQGYGSEMSAGSGISTYTNSDGITIVANTNDIYQVTVTNGTTVTMQLNANRLNNTGIYNYQSVLIVEDLQAPDNLYVFHNNMANNTNRANVLVSYLTYNSGNYTHALTNSQITAPSGVQFSNSLSATYELDAQGVKEGAWIIKQSIPTLVTVGRQSFFDIDYYAYPLRDLTSPVVTHITYDGAISNSPKSPDPPFDFNEFSYNGTDFNATGDQLLTFYQWDLRSFLLDFDQVTGEFNPNSIVRLQRDSGATSGEFDATGNRVLMVVNFNNYYFGTPFSLGESRVVEFDTTTGNQVGEFFRGNSFFDIQRGDDDRFYLSPKGGFSSNNNISIIDGNAQSQMQISSNLNTRYALPEPSLFFENVDCDCNDLQGYAQNLLDSIQQVSSEDVNYDCGKYYFLGNEDWNQCYEDQFTIDWDDNTTPQTVAQFFNGHNYDSTVIGSYTPFINIPGCRRVIRSTPLEVDCPEPCDCNNFNIDIQVELVDQEACVYSIVPVINYEDCVVTERFSLIIDGVFVELNLTGRFEYQFLNNGLHDISISHDFVNTTGGICGKMNAVTSELISCLPEPDCEEAECDREVALNLATALIDNFDYQSSACIAIISGIPMPDCYEAFMIWDDGTVEQIPENGRINHAYILSRLTRKPRIEIRLVSGELCYSTGGIVAVRCNSQMRPVDMNSFTLAPNPTQNEIKILNKNTKFQSVDVSIYDIRGKLYFSKNVTSNETIDLNGYLKGIYIVKIIDEEGVIYNLKLIVE